MTALERVPDVVLVLGVLCGAQGLIQALKLLAAQRAGIAMTVPYTRWLYPSTALFVAWVVIR